MCKLKKINDGFENYLTKSHEMGYNYKFQSIPSKIFAFETIYIFDINNYLVIL